jgi:hypothetical protein
MLLPQEPIANKGPSKNNTIMNQIKESTTTTTIRESERYKNMTSQTSTANKKTKIIKHNNKLTDQIPTMRLTALGL